MIFIINLKFYPVDSNLYVKLLKTKFSLFSHRESSSRHRSSSTKSSTPISTPKRDGSKNRSHSGTPKSRDSSPRVLRPASEEIPLENLNSSSPSSRCSSNAPSRSHTPSRLTTDSTNGLSIAKESVPTTSNGDVVLRQRSEETSFMSGLNEEREKRRKGMIETV